MYDLPISTLKPLPITPPIAQSTPTPTETPLVPTKPSNSVELECATFWYGDFEFSFSSYDADGFPIYTREDHYRNTYNGSEKKVSQRILRWSKSNDTNVDTISMWSENRWVYLEEDDPNSIIGTSYSLSPATILISDESTSNKPWEANWKNFITDNDTSEKQTQWENEITSKTTLFSYDANVVPRKLSLNYTDMEFYPNLCTPTPTIIPQPTTNCHTTDGTGTQTDTINGIAVSNFEENGTFCFDAPATSKYKTTPVAYSIVINTTKGIAISGIVYDYREENGQQPEYNVVYTIADGTESFQGVVEANQTQYAQVRTLLDGLVTDSSDHSDNESIENSIESDEKSLEIAFTDLILTDKSQKEKEYLEKNSKAIILGEYKDGKYEVLTELTYGRSFYTNKLVSGIKFEKVKTDKDEFFVSSLKMDINNTKLQELNYGCMGYYYPSIGIYNNFESGRYDLHLKYDCKSNCVKGK